MSQIEQAEPQFDGWGYPIIAWANGEKNVLYHQFGSYQGEWLMLTKGDGEYKVYKDSYGSCSGCDAYEAESPKSLSEAKKFAEAYKSFIEVPVATMRNLVEAGTLKKIFPANVKDTYSEVSYDEFAADAQIAVKLEENIDVTAADILACKNQEIKQQALKRFGYENFVRDAKMEEIDKDGENSLLKADEIVFAYVKDSSTTRRYLLRVPPTMKTVRQAIAWTFNLRHDEYRPLIET
jgi:hypothetical protein